MSVINQVPYYDAPYGWLTVAGKGAPLFILVQQADQEIRGGWQMNAYQSSCLSGTDNQAVVLKSDETSNPE